MTRIFLFVGVPALLAAGLGACTTPVAGRSPSEAGPAADTGDQERLQALWKNTNVSAGIGECHNLLPEETAMVKSAVDSKRAEIKQCFEDVVLKRGCRTGGIPASFDAMLMIDKDGNVRDTRIVPNKNDLARECHDAVSCVQDVLGQVQVQGLTRFEGARQAYMTVTLVTPSEEAIAAPAAAADAGAP